LKHNFLQISEAVVDALNALLVRTKSGIILLWYKKEPTVSISLIPLFATGRS